MHAPQQKHLINIDDTKLCLSALFEPADVVELRLIETWISSGKHQSLCRERLWIRAEDLKDLLPRLGKRNCQGVNVFFGVNPRSGRGGTKSSVAVCRVLWADLDDTRPEDFAAWQSLPPPSLIIDSGRGVHLYWRLSEPTTLDTSESRNHIEELLRGMYRSISSDSVQDVTRLLRLPGFNNVKDFRNGRAPIPCRLVSYDMKRVYQLQEFDKYKIPVTAAQTLSASTGRDLPKSAFINGSGSTWRIRGLVRLLERESKDRSKRDFFVVAKLLELGCTPEEVKGLVSNHSKFVDNEAYLIRTIQNAQRAISL